jgi:hypothetical protein
LHRCKALRRKLQRGDIHKEAWVNQGMWRIGEDFTPPAVSVESAMNKPVALAGSGIRLLVMNGAEMVTGHMEAAAVELADPALDRNFPVRVAVKKTADDAEADRLAGRRRWR